jgi:hypothetical protein
MAWGGINVLKSGDRIVFEIDLYDDVGAVLAGGTTLMYLLEVQNDGTLKTYDFSDNTFKTTTPAAATQALTHRTASNGTINTGIWTFALTTLTGFTVGNEYIIFVVNANSSPGSVKKKFLFGGTDRDTPVQSVLADGVAHGGTIGSSTATLALSRIVATSQTTDTPALNLTANGNASAMRLVAAGTEPTFLVDNTHSTSGFENHAVKLRSATGMGLYVLSDGGNQTAVQIQSSTGDGIDISGDANGMSINGTNQYGISSSGGAGFYGFDASLSPNTLKSFFEIDSALTYLDAVPGSVVKEIASNAGGGGGGATPAQVATAVWQDTTAGDFGVVGSIGKSLFTGGNVPGSTNGLMIAGSNAATTLDSITVTNLTTFAGAFTATSAGNDVRLGTTERGLIATALLDLADAIETGKTLRQIMRLMAASLFGKRSNSGTASETFYAAGNPATPRIVGNLDTVGDGTPTLTP